MALIDNTDITAESIAKEALDALDAKYQKTAGFFAWDYFVATGRILHTLWQKVIYIAKCLTDLSNMEYDDLVNFVYQTRGIKVKYATASSGSLTLTNGSGKVNIGDIFTTSDGLSFRATESKDVRTNDSFMVECLTKGSAGNVAANTITAIPATIQGFVSVTNPETFTNGYDEESKEDLLLRYYEDIQKPVTSGNIYHYIKWAKEVTGVGDAKVKPLWRGDNTVKVVILNSNREIPSQDLIKRVQDYIDPYTPGDDGSKNGWGCGLGQAPIGAYCTVVPAAAKELNIAAQTVLKSGMELEKVKENIRACIKEYLKTIAFDESVGYISFAKIGSLIMSADGVLDYDNLTLNGGIDNVVLNDNNETSEVAILNELVIGAVEE